MAENIEARDQAKLQEAKEKRLSVQNAADPPNLTSLVDVMFVLMLFFVLVSQIRAEEGVIPGSLPSLLPGKPSPSKPVNIVIHSGGENSEVAFYEVGDGIALIEDAATLHAALQEAAKDGLDVPVTIEPKGDVRWGFVVEAFNQAKRAGFPEVSFKTAQ